MPDDTTLDEIDLAPTRSGSAKRTRHGVARAKATLAQSRQRPLWQRQLSMLKGHRDHVAKYKHRIA